MITCKYCGKPLSPSRVQCQTTFCHTCGDRHAYVLRFIAECEALKRILRIKEEPKE